MSPGPRPPGRGPGSPRRACVSPANRASSCAPTPGRARHLSSRSRPSRGAPVAALGRPQVSGPPIPSDILARRHPVTTRTRSSGQLQGRRSQAGGQGPARIDWAEVAHAGADGAARALQGEALQGRVAGCLHVTKETAVLIRTLRAAGAEVVVGLQPAVDPGRRRRRARRRGARLDLRLARPERRRVLLVHRARRSSSSRP